MGRLIRIDRRNHRPTTPRSTKRRRLWSRGPSECSQPHAHAITGIAARRQNASPTAACGLVQRPYSFLRERSLRIEIFTVVAARRLWKSLRQALCKDRVCYLAAHGLPAATNLTSRQNDDSIKTFGQRTVLFLERILRCRLVHHRQTLL